MEKLDMVLIIGARVGEEKSNSQMELISHSLDGSQTQTCKSSERGIRQAGGTIDLWHTLNC